MTVYSDAFKKKLIQQMLMPNPRPMVTIAREAGVSEASLYRWRDIATMKGMSTDRSDEKPTPPAKAPHEWAAEQKVALVFEAAAISDAELGEFLRRKGIHEAQLKEWQQQVTDGAVAALRGPSRNDRKAANIEERRVRNLEAELRRKDKALAEAAALLILKKKALEIWGAEDDDTDPKSGE